jgi:hypothetical protein
MLNNKKQSTLMLPFEEVVQGGKMVVELSEYPDMNLIK